MDPIAIATGILAFAELISDAAAIGRTFVEVPRVLASLQRDLRITLGVISHISSLLRVYQPSQLFHGVNIVNELTTCINNVRPAVLRLLEAVSNVRGRRVPGFRSLPRFEEAEREIRRHMESFDRLRDSLNMQINVENHAGRRNNENSHHHQQQQHDGPTQPDVPPPVQIQLSEEDIRTGQRAMIGLVHDRIQHLGLNGHHNLDVIEILLRDCNIGPNFASSLPRDNGMTSLHLASESADTALVELLLKHGARVTVQDLAGRTPMHLAEARDGVEVIAALLTEEVSCAESRIDRANARDSQGHTVLWRYARGHSTSHNIFNHLLNLGPEVINFQHNDLELPTVLWAALARGSPPIARLLLDTGADPSIRSSSSSSSNNNNNNNNNNSFSTLLHKVTWPAVEELYPDLIRHGADPTALEGATAREETIRRQPIHCAATAGKLAICEILLALGEPNNRLVDINTLDSDARTPLIAAAEAGHLRLVHTFVVNHNADVSLRDNFGHDAFMAACLGGHVTIASFLLGRQFIRNGAVCDRGLDETDEQGLSALHIAVALGRVEVVRFLVALGASNEGIQSEDVGAMMGGEADLRERVDAIRGLLGMERREVVMEGRGRGRGLGLRRYRTA
ncbi:hypothetical protein OQA88_11609 [Cercophora sp. LCS_1]